MTPWPTCMKNWYYPVYCNPFQMLWWGPDLYSPCVNYTTRSNRAKESHDNSLLMNYVFLQQVSMSVDFWQDKSQGLLIFIFHYLGKWSQCLLGIGNSIVQLFCNKQYNRKHNVPAIPRLDGTSSLIFIFHYLAGKIRKWCALQKRKQGNFVPCIYRLWDGWLLSKEIKTDTNVS